MTGCTKVSAGCKNCYAERLALRLQAMGNRRYANGFRLTMHEDVVDLPRSWSAGRMIFVNSMSDLFHRDVPLEFIQRVFQTMRDCPQHTFPAAVLFLSCEPLIGSLAGINLRNIQWVIVGGESGPHSRSMNIEWVREIFRACRKQHVPFFFKQWGGVRKDRTGRLLRGRTYDEMPERVAA